MLVGDQGNDLQYADTHYTSTGMNGGGRADHSQATLKGNHLCARVKESSSVKGGWVGMRTKCVPVLKGIQSKNKCHPFNIQGDLYYHIPPFLLLTLKPCTLGNSHTLFLGLNKTLSLLSRFFF